MSKLLVGTLGLMIILVSFSCIGQHEDEKINPIFEDIAEAFGDKRIVSLGESSHGIGEYYSFKSDLVQYLHKYHDFEIMAFESGLGDMNLAWTQVDTFSAKGLLKSTLFGNFRCEEVMPLFEYIKAQNNSHRPLIYSGFDNQLSGDFFQDFIREIITHYDKALGDQLDDRLYGYIRWFRAGYYEKPEEYLLEAEQFQETGKQIIEIFQSNRDEIMKDYHLTEFQIDVIIKTAEGFIQTVDIPYDERYRGTEVRDQIMFNNLEWLMNDAYPNKKVILWAHNSHIERQTAHVNGFKWMGHLLAEKYEEDYYALGLFSRYGNSYMHWQDTTITFENRESGMLENLDLFNSDSLSFVDFHSNNYQWSTDTISAYELENGGVISFVPNKRFDGVVVLDKVDQPTFFK